MKKIELNIDDAAMMEIMKLMSATGAKSPGELLGKAIGFMGWAFEKHEQGYIIVAAKEGEQAIQSLIFK